MIGDLVESLPASPDVLIGHSFGGYLAQVGVLNGALKPRALILEDQVSHQPDRAIPEAMLAWDEANLPRDIEGLRKLNPGWTRLDSRGSCFRSSRSTSPTRAPPSRLPRPGICARARRRSRRSNPRCG